ncbi:MAG: hypothetical protein ACXW3P_01340 [Rhodospirillales bacterium]
MTAVGALAILDHTLTIGALVAANMLSGRLLGPLHQLVAGWRGFVAARLAIERLSAVFALAEAPRGRNVAMVRPLGRVPSPSPPAFPRPSTTSASAFRPAACMCSSAPTAAARRRC